MPAQIDVERDTVALLLNASVQVATWAAALNALDDISHLIPGEEAEE